MINYKFLCLKLDHLLLLKRRKLSLYRIYKLKTLILPKICTIEYRIVLGKIYILLLKTIYKHML